MACTPDDVRDLDLNGAFSALTDPQIQKAIDDASLVVCDTEVWGDKLDLGVCLLAAHFLLETLNSGTGTGPAGPVTAEAAGGLSRSFGSLSGAAFDSGYSTTLFGRRYLELMRTLDLTPFVLGVR